MPALQRNSGHCIHQLLPPTKVQPMKLRDSHCVFALPQCHYNLYKHSFVLRNLFVSDIVFFVCFLVLNSLFMLCYAFNLLMAFDRLLLKGLLTYLLNVSLNSPGGSTLLLRHNLYSLYLLSPVHTGDKVELNTVDFVESRQSRPRRFGLVHSAYGFTTMRYINRLFTYLLTHWQQSRPRQAVEFTLLPICCQNRQQS